jgi:hypothetical protein
MTHEDASVADTTMSRARLPPRNHMTAKHPGEHMSASYHTYTRIFRRGWEHTAIDGAAAKQESHVGKAGLPQPVDESDADLVWGRLLAAHGPQCWGRNLEAVTSIDARHNIAPLNPDTQRGARRQGSLWSSPGRATKRVRRRGVYREQLFQGTGKSNRRPPTMPLKVVRQANAI